MADQLPFDREAEFQPRQDTGITPGWITLWSDEADERLHCLQGAEPPTVVRGYGGWTTVDRDGRWGVSHWPGGPTPAVQLTFSLRSTGGGPRSARDKMRALEVLCGWGEAPAERRPPPVCQFKANAPHHDASRASQSEWVCESLEWGELVFTNRATLMRADATAVFGLYVVAEVPGLERARPFKVHTLKAGWDLRHFAGIYLHDASRWNDVVALNRDNPRCPSTPHFKVTKPVRLRVPPREPRTKSRSKRGRR